MTNCPFCTLGLGLILTDLDFTPMDSLTSQELIMMHNNLMRTQMFIENLEQNPPSSEDEKMERYRLWVRQMHPVLSPIREHDPEILLNSREILMMESVNSYNQRVNMIKDHLLMNTLTADVKVRSFVQNVMIMLRASECCNWFVTSFHGTFARSFRAYQLLNFARIAPDPPTSAPSSSDTSKKGDKKKKKKKSTDQKKNNDQKKNKDQEKSTDQKKQQKCDISEATGKLPGMPTELASLGCDLTTDTPEASRRETRSSRRHIFRKLQGLPTDPLNNAKNRNVIRHSSWFILATRIRTRNGQSQQTEEFGENPERVFPDTEVENGPQENPEEIHECEQRPFCLSCSEKSKKNETSSEKSPERK